MGDAFVGFTTEVLASTFSEIHTFAGGGKDGAIDFSADIAIGRMVGEGKLVSSDDFADVQARWREVIKRLRRHLASPDGPTVGQAQYEPWYSLDPPIRQYVFCTSAVIKTQKRLDQLKKEIRGDLRGLGREYPHLSHLSNIKILVLDWRKLLSLATPHTLYRWFVDQRPHGLVPIDISSQADVGTFREYLQSERMTYYSLADHLRTDSGPEGTELPNEQTIVEALHQEDALGVLIAGAGGLGKTRLTLEIGRTAARQEWVVLRVFPPLDRAALDRLVEGMDRGSRVLLLFDYVETQRGFAGIADRLYGYNATYELTIRYVANCRTSFLPVVTGIRGQSVIDLSPADAAPTSTWRRAYRRATVRHILTEVGLGDDDRGLHVAGDRPMVAVLLAYLHTTGRGLDLHELLGLGDFGAWIAKRVGLTFPGASVTRDLALLCALLPTPDDLHGLERSRFQPLVDRLAADGWIEPGTDAEHGLTWRAIHDVMTDQVVAAFLTGIPATVDGFASELFALSADAGSLDSAVISLQRLADTPSVQGVDWTRVFDQSLAQAPDAWRISRGLVLQTSLLDPRGVLFLLGRHAAVWDGMHEDPDIQDSLARLNDRVDNEPGGLTDDEEQTLRKWLTAAASAAGVVNLVLTRALRRFPEDVAEIAKEWLARHAEAPQADFVMAAWLRAGLDAGAVRQQVARWLILYGYTRDASFLLRWWLATTHDWEAVQDATQRWLTRHALHVDTTFVLRAWLEAGGDHEVAREPIVRWLKIHGDDTTAEFVYRSWVNAGGDHDVVREPFIHWMKSHGRDLSAPFVYSAWLNAKGDADVVHGSIVEWLSLHATTREAGFVYFPWLRAGADPETIREPLTQWLELHGTEPEARFVYQPWLDAGADPETIRKPLTQWLRQHGTDPEARFVYQPWLDARADPETIREPLIRWLEHHATDPEASHVYQPWLSAGADPEVIREPLTRWLQLHAAALEASHVYEPWLNAGADPEVVRGPLTQWLADHATAPEASHVYEPWLNAGADPEVIREPLTRWLEQRATESEATFIFQPWLNAKADPEVIREPLTRWLQHHTTDLEARFVYQPWLNAGADPGAIRGPLTQWLQHHATALEARYVYLPWLNAKADPEVIREPLTRWLQQHATEPEATYIYQPWLNAKADPEVIREPLTRWLQQHATEPEATFIFQPWLNAGADPEVIREPVTRWLNLHATEPEARFVYQPWLDAKADPEVIREALARWLQQHATEADAAFLYKSWLDAGGSHSFVRDSIARWLVQHALNPAARFVYKPWLASGGDPELVREPVARWLATTEWPNSAAVIRHAWNKATGGEFL